MEALILAAGYATRLGELTRDTPKPLLPVGPRPMIDYIFDQLADTPDISRVHVVTNGRFAPQFGAWATGRTDRKPISLINDNTTCDEDKLGAVGDIRLAVRQNRVDDDLLIVAGDNLFDFPLARLLDFFRLHGSTVGLYDTGKPELMSQYAVVELDSSGRIISFHEKPSQPRSTLAATAIYVLQRQRLPLLERYAQAGGKMDAPGYFIEWLTKQVPVFGFPLPGDWRDIGTPEEYRQAQIAYHSHGQRELRAA